MSHAVPRSLIGVALAAGLALTGCGGPGPGSAAEVRPTDPAGPSTPPPSGAGCAAAGDIAALAELNLVDAAKQMTATQTFATYLTADADREKQYRSLGGVTAFVPVDSAWTTLDPTAAQQLTDPYWHQAVVEYSLVPAELTPEAFTGGQTGAMQTFRAPGAVLSGHAVGESIVLNGHANVVCSAVPFDGGLIYLIDTVMLPSA